LVDRTQLARLAASAALRLRHRGGVALTDPASPIDLAERLGIKVQFLKTKSLEGMFVATPEPQILLSSLRPTGRINFTCAHELGHRWFGHQAHVDAATEGDEPLLLADSEDEFQANAFASSLLMPKTTVQHGFVKRKVHPDSASPRQVLAVAHWLGVGFTTLVHHLHKNLHLIGPSHAADMLKLQPKKILKPDLGADPTGTAFVVDRAWTDKPVDMEVGDIAIVDGTVSLTGLCVQVKSSKDDRTLVVAVAPGTGHIDGGAGWSTYVRVRRHQFEGRSVFRHLEEEPDDGS
jgi:hypothetical protein